MERIYEEEWFPSEIKCNWKPSNLRRSSFEGENGFDDKNDIPLDIVKNDKDVQTYKDNHLEVFVKSEAIVKNFIDCFNLTEFKDLSSISIYSYTESYYENNYTISEWSSGVSYSIGNKVKRNNKYYLCKENHTSSSTFDGSKWDQIPDTNWLIVNNNIDEYNYSKEFPFVSSLIFKNLWGCDMYNFLNLYVKKSNLTICYSNLFSEALRKSSLLYNKFFEIGYFVSEFDGGVRLVLGESLKNDEILGENILNNYFECTEYSHFIGEDWDYSADNVNTDYFGGNLVKPFDHFYTFVPKIGIPFFKEKTFEDCKLNLTLEKEDVFGNIYKRIVNLPIYITLNNNLIKVYWKSYSRFSETSPYYESEFLNSNQIYAFTGSVSDNSDLRCRSTIWCPNVKRLSLSSYVSTNVSNIKVSPHLTDMKGENNIDGQTVILDYTIEKGSKNSNFEITVFNNLEYNDGINYDQFIYIEKVTVQVN